MLSMPCPYPLGPLQKSLCSVPCLETEMLGFTWARASHPSQPGSPSYCLTWIWAEAAVPREEPPQPALFSPSSFFTTIILIPSPSSRPVPEAPPRLPHPHAGPAALTGPSPLGPHPFCPLDVWQHHFRSLVLGPHPAQAPLPLSNPRGLFFLLNSGLVAPCPVPFLSG